MLDARKEPIEVLTLVALSAYMALAAAVMFTVALFSHLRWWYRHTFESLAEAFAVSDAPSGRLGMVDVATGIALFGLLGLPQALYTVFPGSVTPVVLVLTGGATIGLFGLGTIMIGRGYALAFLGARYRSAVEAGIGAEKAKLSDEVSGASRMPELHTQAKEYWLRLGEFTQAGLLGEGLTAIFHLLISLWVLRVGFAMVGETPYLGLTGLFVGFWGGVSALIRMWRGLVRPDLHQASLRTVGASL